MIHIMREHETIDDIAYIYNVSKETVLTYNPHLLNCTNSSVWVDCGGVVSFNEITKERTEYPYYRHEELALSVIHKVESVDSAFVTVDNWARNCKEVFIDGYTVDEQRGELNLPGDYPSINACTVNGIVPSFALTDLLKYANESVINMLLTDLSFKEYRNVMLVAKNYNEYVVAVELEKILRRDGLGVDIACEYNVIKRMNTADNFDHIYYMTERNIIDFDSFAQNVTELLSEIGEAHFGVLYEPRYVDINKSTSEISYVTAAEAAETVKRLNADRINFDDDSQLCWIKYTERDNSIHSLLFEDIRTFYAKAAFLAEKRVKNVCLQGCNCYTNVLGKIFGIVK